jgi:hypothetical protein
MKEIPTQEPPPRTTESEETRSNGGALVDVHPLVLRFLAGEWVRRFCGSGDRGDETNWLHVRWQGSQPYGLPVMWWGFGGAMTDERIVFQILLHPEEWEISTQNVPHHPRQPEVGVDNTQNL